MVLGLKSRDRALHGFETKWHVWADAETKPGAQWIGKRLPGLGVQWMQWDKAERANRCLVGWYSDGVGSPREICWWRSAKRSWVWLQVWLDTTITALKVIKACRDMTGANRAMAAAGRAQVVPTRHRGLVWSYCDNGTGLAGLETGIMKQSQRAQSQEEGERSNTLFKARTWPRRDKQGRIKHPRFTLISEGSL